MDAGPGVAGEARADVLAQGAELQKRGVVGGVVFDEFGAVSAFDEE